MTKQSIFGIVQTRTCLLSSIKPEPEIAQIIESHHLLHYTVCAPYNYTTQIELHPDDLFSVILRDQHREGPPPVPSVSGIPSPALPPGTGVPHPKPTGDHGSGNLVYLYHPRDPSSLPLPPGTGVPQPNPTGHNGPGGPVDIHNPSRPSSLPPPPGKGVPQLKPTSDKGHGNSVDVHRPGQSSPPPPMAARHRRTFLQVRFPPLDLHRPLMIWDQLRMVLFLLAATSTTLDFPHPLWMLNRHRTLRVQSQTTSPKVLLLRGTGIPKPIPTDPSAVLPPPPKDAKLPAPNRDAPKGNAPAPSAGIPKPIPTTPSSVALPVVDARLALNVPAPVPDNKAPKDNCPAPGNRAPKPTPSFHPANNAAVPPPVADVKVALNAPGPVPNNNNNNTAPKDTAPGTGVPKPIPTHPSSVPPPERTSKPRSFLVQHRSTRRPRLLLLPPPTAN